MRLVHVQLSLSLSLSLCARARHFRSKANVAAPNARLPILAGVDDSDAVARQHLIARVALSLNVALTQPALVVSLCPRGARALTTVATHHFTNVATDVRAQIALQVGTNAALEDCSGFIFVPSSVCPSAAVPVCNGDNYGTTGNASCVTPGQLADSYGQCE
jgi:hypothetical protein